MLHGRQAASACTLHNLILVLNYASAVSHLNDPWNDSAQALDTKAFHDSAVASEVAFQMQVPSLRVINHAVFKDQHFADSSWCGLKWTN